jgi:hypothetical protein
VLRLLREAFDVLDQAAASDKNDWGELGNACTSGASLLPIVEQVDTQMVREFLSRTLALRPHYPGPVGSDWAFDTTNAYVAAIVARFVRAVSRQLDSGFAKGALARQIGLTDWHQGGAGEELFFAAAVLDPARAAAMIDD